MGISRFKKFRSNSVGYDLVNPFDSFDDQFDGPFVDEPNSDLAAASTNAGKLAKPKSGKSSGSVNKTKRPPNAFMLYRMDMIKQVKKEHNLVRNQDISRKCGEMWRAEPESVKAKYQEMSAKAFKTHFENNPDFVWMPNYKGAEKLDAKTMSEARAGKKRRASFPANLISQRRTSQVSQNQSDQPFANAEVPNVLFGNGLGIQGLDLEPNGTINPRLLFSNEDPGVYPGSYAQSTAFEDFQGHSDHQLLPRMRRASMPNLYNSSYSSPFYRISNNVFQSVNDPPGTLMRKSMQNMYAMTPLMEETVPQLSEQSYTPSMYGASDSLFETQLPPKPYLAQERNIELESDALFNSMGLLPGITPQMEALRCCSPQFKNEPFDNHSNFGFSGFVAEPTALPGIGSTTLPSRRGSILKNSNRAEYGYVSGMHGTLPLILNPGLMDSKIPSQSLALPALPSVGGTEPKYPATLSLFNQDIQKQTINVFMPDEHIFKLKNDIALSPDSAL